MPYGTYQNSTFFPTPFYYKIVPFPDQIELQIVPQIFINDFWLKVEENGQAHTTEYKISFNNVALFTNISDGLKQTS